MKSYCLSDFDFHLPEKLIAQTPPAQRGQSRLLEVAQGRLTDRQFPEVKTLLRPGDVLVVNDTKVIPARLLANKGTGGKLEMMVERVTGEHQLLTQVKASHRPKIGDAIYVQGRQVATVIADEPPFMTLQTTLPALTLLQQYGQIPLPPYIEREPQAEDQTRYQTVYAKHPGAVAAPTAGLHFTDELLDELRAAGVQLLSITLHVGAGTFQPVRTEQIDQHKMHSEWFNISEESADAINQCRQQRGRVVAVGTTTLRALESASTAKGVAAGARETDIFITPGYRFQTVDALITNFHLPRSTLMMLVSAFAGYDVIREAYQHAIAQEYRFFSYGDAMWLHRNEHA